MAGNKKPRKPSSGPRREAAAVLPMVFSMSPEQAERLKRIPLDSLNLFQEKKAKGIDATNIFLRLMTGLYLAENVVKNYNVDGDIIKPLQDAISAMRSMMFRADQTKANPWNLSPGETVLVIEGLDVVNDLQDQVTRREMAFAFREAQKAISDNFEKEKK